MNAKRTMFAAVAAVSLAAIAGETLNVSNKAYTQMNTVTNAVAGTTTKQGTAYPAGAPQPLFWLDCSDRMGGRRIQHGCEDPFKDGVETCRYALADDES